MAFVLKIEVHTVLLCAREQQRWGQELRVTAGLIGLVVLVIKGIVPQHQSKQSSGPGW